MLADRFEELKAACALINAGLGAVGTGYLVSEDLIVTCEHVIRGANLGDPVTVRMGEKDLLATLTKVDTDADCAVLTLKEKAAGVTPLLLAGECRRQAVWDGYGYPGLARGSAIPLNGTVMDPNGKDKAARASLILFSPQVAAGMASSVHGFSGSPVMVEGHVVGHLTRILGDDDYAGKAAYGLLYATPSKAVLKLCGIAPAAPFVEAADTGAIRIPPIGPDEYHVVVSCIAKNREFADQLVNAFNIAGFRAIVDQRDLSAREGGPRDPATLLSKSQAAVTLMSKPWVASYTRRQWDNLLDTKREFRLIPIKLDDCDPPQQWKAIPAADWRELPAPQGASLERLLYSVAGQQAPLQIVFDDLDETAKRIRLAAQRRKAWRAGFAAAAALLAIGVFFLPLSFWRMLHAIPAAIPGWDDYFDPNSNLASWDYPAGKWSLVKGKGKDSNGVIVTSDSLGVPKGTGIDGGAFYDFNLTFEARFVRGNRISWAYRVQADKKTAYVFELNRSSELILASYIDPGHRPIPDGVRYTGIHQCCEDGDVIEVRSEVRNNQFQFWFKINAQQDLTRNEIGFEYPAGDHPIVDNRWFLSRLRYGNVGFLETEPNSEMGIEYIWIKQLP